jgi:PAS domain S-box-containing protein
MPRLSAKTDLPAQVSRTENSGDDLLRRRNEELQREVEQLQALNRSLSDSEQRLRLAIATGRIGLWVWNSTDVNNAGDWSPRLKEIFGLPLETEVTHEIFLNCVHPEDRERVNAAVLHALQGIAGGEYASEYRIIRADDQAERWVTARGQAFFDALRVPVRFIGTLMDITDRKLGEQSIAETNAALELRVAERTEALAEINRTLESEIEDRKRAEAALQRRENDLRVAIDTIPGLVWTCRPDGYVEYHNQRWIDYTGLRPEVASGWGWQVAIHPDDLAGLAAHWKSLLAAGEAGQCEARFRRSDGEFRWFLFQGVPLRNAEGHVTRWYGMNTDIQELRASEQLARGQVEALRQTLAGLATESEPEKFLEHVLQTLVDRLDAEGIGAWLLNAETGRVEFVGTWEDGKLHLPKQAEMRVTSPFPEAPEEHPVWAEFFRTGAYCVVGELRDDNIYVRAAEQHHTSWHPYLSKSVAHPETAAIAERLRKKGIVRTLCVPMFVRGKVTGFLSIRFREVREFQSSEIELARALAHQAMLAIQLVRLAQQSREAAVIAERNRLARDIHDTLAQGFTGIIVQLEAAEDAESRGLGAETMQHLSRASDLARESLQEARRSVQALRPQVLEHHQLPAAFESLFEKMTAGTAVRTELIVAGTPRRLVSEVEENLLRIVQEALANALRHASADHFVVRLAYEAQDVRIELRDDGRGFDTTANHQGWGLRGMKERVETMGGRIAVKSAAEIGTSISIFVPTGNPSSPETTA